MMQPTRNTLEITEDGYLYLMHDLSLAGANDKTPYGAGWTADHPELGTISVSRVKRPARLYNHPPYAFFVTCLDAETLAKVQSNLASRPPLIQHKVR